ncbi:MAG: KEOPS complex subunit Pcc1 [archaeon GBS-70-058]|nr:KEOPS complex subunit Pcc1 [Candidatus Culexarchaeum nevadense]
MFEVELTLDFKDPAISKIVFESLSPEVANPPSRRVNTLIEHYPPKIFLYLSSYNPSLLRAALNSFLRLIMLLEEIFKSLKSEALS